MKKKFVGILLVFLIWVMAGVLEKIIFLTANAGSIGEFHLTDVLAMIGHGLRLDMAIAGYLTAVPALVLTIALWTKHRVVTVSWHVFMLFFAFVFVLASCANILLYAYWGFPLDSTLVFYTISSPKDAVASASIWLILLALLMVVLFTALLYYPFRRVFGRAIQEKLPCGVVRKLVASVAFLLITASLFIPIRGGFSVAVNNVGTAYYSDNVRYNHVAVNPLFSLMESLTSDNDFSTQYRYLEAEVAAQLFREMVYTRMRDHLHPDSLAMQATLSPAFLSAMNDDERKAGVRVVLVVLESFSSYIMDGGEGHLTGITPELQQLTSEGLYFTNFYSNSFRTDRALVSILSGYPAQPMTSLMKYPHKTNGLYSIARSLSNEGFRTKYIYGGDANFTNMRSYLMDTGFSDLVDENDYPAKDRTGKWGVNDSVLFDKALAEIAKADKHTNTFHVIQTSSSHEPFDVPAHYLDNRSLNAFRYTDAQLGRFVKALKEQEEWQRTLLVIVPDHAGCYPEPEPDGFAPYFNSIPLLMLGGAVPVPREVTTLGCQQDMAATLLAMLGIDHSEFTFSKDMFDSQTPHFAFFTFPDAVGMVTADSHFMFDNRSRKMIYNTGKPAGKDLQKAQAYLQILYDDIAAR